jgi:hypothetical protein
MMAKFYFHLHDGDGWTHDTEGSECQSVELARYKAMAAVRDLICGDVMAGRPIVLSDRVAVDDHRGDEVASVTFGEAITVREGS